jgi:hypothetical protein
VWRRTAKIIWNKSFDSMVKENNNNKPKKQNTTKPKPAAPKPKAKASPNGMQKVKAQVVENMVLKQQSKVVSDILLSTILPGDGKSMRLPFQADQKTAVVDWEVDAVKQCGGEAEILGLSVSLSRTQALVLTGQPGVPWLETLRVTGWLFGMTGTKYLTHIFTGANAGSVNDGCLHVDYFAGTLHTPNGSKSVTLPTVEGPAFSNSETPANTARQRAAYVPGGAYPFLVIQADDVASSAAVGVVIRAVRYDDRGRAVETIVYDEVNTGFLTIDNGSTFTRPLKTTTFITPLPAGYYQFYHHSYTGADFNGKLSMSVALGPANGSIDAPLAEKMWSGDALLPITPPRLATLEDPYTAARATSCAILASNATNMFNIEGSVLGARLDAQAYFPSAATTATQSRAREAVKAKRYFGLLRDGAYFFAPLETQLLQYRDYVESGIIPLPLLSASSTTDSQEWDFGAYESHNVPIYHAGLSVPFSVVYLTDNGGVTAPGATTMNLRLEMHVEYRTDNPQLTLGVARGEQADLLLAQQVLASLPYFYENPTHWERVMQRLRAAWGTIRPYAPQLMLGMGRAAGAAFPEAAPMLHAAAAMGALKFR